MSEIALANAPAPPRPPLKESLGFYIAWGVLFALLAWAYKGSDIRPGELFSPEGMERMGRFVSSLFSPDFQYWEHYLKQMSVSLATAVWGTFLAIVFGAPLGILCAENVVPGWIHQPMRRLADALRAINEFVFALIFIVAVGLGPFAGMLALFVHTTGVLMKLFAEAVEAIDPRPVEGIRATGATRVQEVIFGIIPQVIPLWISYSLYRFESNLRSATVIGLVGAGGIGQTLHESMSSFQYDYVSAILIIIIITVSITDAISQQLRKMVL